MKVLVTGHAGFVGKAFTKRLLEDGHEVTGVDIEIKKPDWMKLYQSRELWKAGQLDYVVDDIRRFMKLREADEFELIIHCAAIVGGRLNIDGDPLAVATNLSIDSEFFWWITKAKRDPHVVYFSSSAVYPVDLQMRRTHCALSEGLVDLGATRFGMPDQSYGFAKFAGELLARKAVQDYGAKVVIYRPFGGYGEDQDMNYPFPSIIKRVIDRENPLVVWGSGEQQRDFIHIDDIVEAVLSTYAKISPGETLNLGTGVATSFIALARMACGEAGYRPKITADTTKPEGVFSRVCDIYKLEDWYAPKIGIIEGIRRMLKALTPVDA